MKRSMNKGGAIVLVLLGGYCLLLAILYREIKGQLLIQVPLGVLGLGIAWFGFRILDRLNSQKSGDA